MLAMCKVSSLDTPGMPWPCDDLLIVYAPSGTAASNPGRRAAPGLSAIAPFPESLPALTASPWAAPLRDACAAACARGPAEAGPRDPASAAGRVAAAGAGSGARARGGAEVLYRSLSSSMAWGAQCADARRVGAAESEVHDSWGARGPGGTRGCDTCAARSRTPRGSPARTADGTTEGRSGVGRGPAAAARRGWGAVPLRASWPCMPEDERAGEARPPWAAPWLPACLSCGSPEPVASSSSPDA